MSGLELRNVVKRFGDVTVVQQMDLAVTEGEFLVLLGESGCGKSTTLRMIAGLEEVTEGRIFIGDRDVTDLHPMERDIAMVFQNYALYPHMDVGRNMSFSLKIAGVPADEVKAKVAVAAKILNIEHLLSRKPKDLSGGQRQRVAIGRAIVRAPKVFLFDEPLSNLDAALRGQTRVEIAKLHRDLGATTVYVTHDQVEAMTLADRVVVLREGRVEQVGTPLALYDKPANQFVAQFIGTPQMNVLASAVVPQLAQAFSIPVPAGGFIGLRPESVMITGVGSGQLRGKVDLVEALGAETLIYMTSEQGAQLVSRQNTRTHVRVGEEVGIAIDTATAHLFDAKGRIAHAGAIAGSAVG